MAARIILYSIYTRFLHYDDDTSFWCIFDLSIEVGRARLPLRWASTQVRLIFFAIFWWNMRCDADILRAWHISESATAATITITSGARALSWLSKGEIGLPFMNFFWNYGRVGEEDITRVIWHSRDVNDFWLMKYPWLILSWHTEAKQFVSQLWAIFTFTTNVCWWSTPMISMASRLMKKAYNGILHTITLYFPSTTKISTARVTASITTSLIRRRLMTPRGADYYYMILLFRFAFFSCWSISDSPTFRGHALYQQFWFDRQCD